MTVLVQEQRRIVDEGIAQVNAELTRHLSVLRRDLWAIRRRMSTTLHGSVQSALTSAMLLLSTDPSPANVSEVRQRLDQALLAIDLDEQAAAVIEHGLREISAVWSGVAEVNASTSAEAMALLAHQQGLSAAVLEIAREGVGNAIRHGRAQEVDVRIVIIEGGLISIVIADDGSGLGDDVRAGLGSLMLDEVCISWHRESAEKGVRLTAVLA
jgi:signal transduction histidine kinase